MSKPPAFLSASFTQACKTQDWERAVLEVTPPSMSKPWQDFIAEAIGHAFNQGVLKERAHWISAGNKLPVPPSSPTHGL